MVRHHVGWDVIAAPMRAGKVRLASVVAFELLVGARRPGDRNDLMAIIRRADQAGWTITPDLADWTTAANIVASYDRRYGRVERRDHLADVLLVLCAGRVRGEVVTTNLRHLTRWAGVARRFHIDVRVSAAG